MNRIVQILDKYMHFSQQDSRLLDGLLNDVQTTVKSVAGRSGGGRVLEVGNLSVDYSGGIELLHDGKRTIVLSPTGDALFGKDVDIPSGRSLSIFSNDQLYNKEKIGAGDVLLGDNSTGKANLYWDRSTGQLKFRTGITSGIILDTDGTMKSGNYSYRSSGWIIDPAGYAEFNDVHIRGSMYASVYEYGHVTATGGQIIVSKDSGVLYGDFTTPALSSTVTVKIQTHGDKTQWGDVNDVIRIQTFVGTNIRNAYLKLTTYIGTYFKAGASGGDYWSEYVATMLNGNVGATFKKGTGITNYGASGGYIRLAAGEGMANSVASMAIFQHTGQPWTADMKINIGDMYGTYGTGISHKWGIGIGDFNQGNYLSYNAEATNAFVIHAGDGSVIIDGAGITIIDPSTGGPSSVQKIVWDYATGYEIGEVFGDYGGGSLAVIYLRGVVQAGASWTKTAVWISAEGQTIQPYIYLSDDVAGGRLLINDVNYFKITSPSLGDTLYLDTAGDLTLYGDFIYTGNLKSYKNSQPYEVYGFHPLTTPATHTSWDGDMKSSTSGTFDLQNAGTWNLPANIKAVLVRLVIKETSASIDGTQYLSVGPSASYDNVVTVRPQVQNFYAETIGICPCDGNGDIRYEVVAAAASSMECHVQIYGYWI